VSIPLGKLCTADAVGGKYVSSFVHTVFKIPNLQLLLLLLCTEENIQVMSKDTALCGCAVVTLLAQIYRPPHIKRNITIKGQ
jgi:hypothetical protein